MTALATTGRRSWTERRLVGLMFARLALVLLSCGIALGMDALGRSLADEARAGLWWTVGAAFLATGLSAVRFPHLRSPGRFAAAQLAVDVVLVTALVAFSGGRDSIFGFLYVCVTVYGAVFFDRRGAFGAALLSALAYGAMLLALNEGWAIGVGSHEPVPLAVLGAVWAVQLGALFLVGALASALSGELHRTGEVLSQRTSDLQRLRQLHQRTVESIMSGLLTTDEALRLTSFNPEAEHITGLSGADWIGRDVGEVIPGARELLSRVVEGRTGGGGEGRVRLRYTRGDGEELFLGLAGSILRDERGAPCGTVLIFQDVSRVVQMEEDLRRSERLAAVGELSAKIAHEIRNPLAAISGSIEVLRNAVPPGDDDGAAHAQLMGIVLRETERLNGLITDFLGYARPRRPSLERVELAGLFEDLLKMFEAARPEAVGIACEPPGDLAVLADPDQMRQLLWNLCLNAMQAMPEGGELRLAAAERPGAQGMPAGGRNGAGDDSSASAGDGGDRRVPSMVEISVADTGVGIPPEVQERMFEPFFTTRKEGSGLGLATVHRIVESHDGVLELESAVGRGSVFRVRLPAAEGSV